MTLPATEMVRARPVWQRYLRRLRLEHTAATMISSDAGFSIPVGPPTEEEKADAIEVLRIAPEWLENLPDPRIYRASHDATKAMIAEAERIFLEASVPGGYGG